MLSPQTIQTDTGIRFAIGRTPMSERFAWLKRAFGSKIAGNGLSLLLGAMRFRIQPKEAAEELAPEVTLPDIGDYVRWAMILPPDGSLGAPTRRTPSCPGWGLALRTCRR